jgi:hypothetical protein
MRCIVRRLCANLPRPGRYHVGTAMTGQSILSVSAVSQTSPIRGAPLDRARAVKRVIATRTSG